MEKHVLSILVENHAGVLSRIAGLFSRRGYNISSLSVAETENENISRMTIVVEGDRKTVEQIKKQVNKLINTIKILELDPSNAVFRHLVLVKVAATQENRAAIIQITDIFRAKIIDVSNSTVTAELTGDENKVDGFIKLLEPYGIKELISSGCTGIERG